MIGLYFDRGVDSKAGREAARALKPYGAIKRLKAGQITRETLDQCELLVMPGGRDIFYHEALSGERAAAIRSWVEDGGSYLGICAGAYFGCHSIDFERGYELEVIAARDLAFFPGVARGPALGLGVFEYTGYGGSSIEWLCYGAERVPVYYNGGCTFVGGSGPDCEVVAWYEQTKEPAILFCKVGLGRVCLMGSHPEFSPKNLNHEHVGKEALATYARNYSKTERLWEDALSGLGVNRSFCS